MCRPGWWFYRLSSVHPSTLSMASVFDSYDEEFCALVRDMGKNISHVSTYETDIEKKMTLLRGIDNTMQQTRDLLKSMEIEVRGQEHPPTKKSMAEKTQQFKKTLAALTADYAAAKLSTEREALHGDNCDEATVEQRDRLMASTDRLGKGTDRIRRAQEVLADTESTAMEICHELDRSREKIDSAHLRIHQVRDLTDSARRLIRNMSKREVQQKLILAFTATLILAAIGVTIYLLVEDSDSRRLEEAPFFASTKSTQKRLRWTS